LQLFLLCFDIIIRSALLFLQAGKSRLDWNRPIDLPLDRDMSIRVASSAHQRPHAHRATPTGLLLGDCRHPEALTNPTISRFEFRWRRSPVVEFPAWLAGKRDCRITVGFILFYAFSFAGL